jgi:hypothetical protein
LIDEVKFERFLRAAYSDDRLGRDLSRLAVVPDHWLVGPDLLGYAG